MTKPTIESAANIFTHVFNRTVLGMWTLLALYLGFKGEYTLSGVMVFVGIPVYFALTDIFEE